MNSYHYTVSLRLWHPKRDLAPAGQVFGLRPTHAWVEGQPRKTPTGTALSGTNSNSYWTARLSGERKISSKRQDLESFILRTVEHFRDRRLFIQRLRKTGGRAELFVGLYSEKNFGFELPPPLLRAAATLGLALSLDIYPTP